MTSTSTLAPPDSRPVHARRPRDRWRGGTTPTRRARRAFVAAALGWMLDSFDVMLYSLVLAALIQDPTLQLSHRVAGQLGA